MPDTDQESRPEEEGGGFWGTVGKVASLAGDAAEIAETAGVELIPLIGTAVHATEGIIHASNMYWAEQDSQNDVAPVDYPEFDTPEAGNERLAQSARDRQRAMREGEEAQEQFFEAIPLIGTAVGLGGEVAHLINPEIEPARTLWGGSSENYSFGPNGERL